MKGRSTAKPAPAVKSSGGSSKSRPTGQQNPRAEMAKYLDIRKDLERQRAAILEEAGGVLTNRPDVPTFPDVSDQASAEVDQNFSMRIRDRERKLLKKIDEALDRMNDATYGICEQCGATIPYKRLKARPVTTFCIACKTAQEEEERSRR